MIQISETCLQLRGLIVNSYALLEPGNITLIDGGFLTMKPSRVAAELNSIGRDISEVSRILLTHGHIDHTLNVAELKKRSGAAVHAPAKDAAHIAGCYPYRGLARVCGWGERIARSLSKYEPPTIDVWFEPGATIEAWGRLEVVPLPGHTRGHVGFYSRERKLLFSGDLFANFLRRAKLPPCWFNTHPELIPESLARATALDLAGGVLPNHGHSGTPEEHRDDLIALAKRFPDSHPDLFAMDGSGT